MPVPSYDFSGKAAVVTGAGGGMGEAIALALVKAGAATVNESLDVIMALAGAPRLCLLGGLAPLYPEWLSEQHRAILIEAQADALTGAVALAAKGHRERRGAAS